MWSPATFLVVTTLCSQKWVLCVAAGQGAPLLPSARSPAAPRPDASMVSSPKRGPTCPGQSLQAEQGIPGCPFLVIKTDLLSGSQLIRAAWGLGRSSVPLDTGQVGGSHSRQAQEEPGTERPGLGPAAPGTAASAQAAGSSRP